MLMLMVREHSESAVEDSGSLISETEERKTVPDAWYARYARGTAGVRLVTGAVTERAVTVTVTVAVAVAVITIDGED